MTKKEAYAYLLSAWSSAESEYGSFDVEFDECIQCLVSESDLVVIKEELDAEYRERQRIGREESDALFRAGVYVKDENYPECPYKVNQEFYDRDLEGYRKLRDETLIKFRNRI